MILVLAFALIVAFFSFTVIRLMKTPDNDPPHFLREKATEGSKIVACVGASTVRGQVSYNFVDYLDNRLRKENYRFINAGVNGDLAYNVLQRMPEVLSCKPEYIIIAIGGNDIMASLDARSGERYIRMKHLPERPSIEWYEENIRKIIATAKESGIRNIAIMSATLLGERIPSRANTHVEEYNNVLSKVAIEMQVYYLDIYKKQIEYLKMNQTSIEMGNEYVGQTKPMMESLFLHGVLGYSLDKISERNGLLLNTDYIHQNSVSGKLIAAEIENFLGKNES